MIYWFLGAVVAALLLIALAPRPAWVALVIAGAGAFAAVETRPSAPSWWQGCPGGVSACLVAVEEDPYEPSFMRFILDWPTIPAWLVVAGVLGWAIRRRSWRTAIAGAVYGAAVFAMPHEAPIVLVAAATAALGPRKDAHFLAGVGLFALAWADLPWTLLVAIAVPLALAIWAAATKNGVNVAVALVSLASAPLTPFLSAGVLLATALIRRTAAGSAGTPDRRPARPDPPGI
ncbi:hypothetical protein ACWGE0_37850 [Lentzea sp. NPDC054927]